MAIQNKSVTILGATAKVSSFTVFPQADGSYVISAGGTATDSLSGIEQLSLTANFPAVAVLDNMSARVLTELRKANGLET